MVTPVHIVRKHWRMLNKPVARAEAKAQTNKAAVEERVEARKMAQLKTTYSDAAEMLRLIEAHPSPAAIKRLVDIKNNHPDKRIKAKAASVLLKWASNPTPRKKRKSEKW